MGANGPSSHKHRKSKQFIIVDDLEERFVDSDEGKDDAKSNASSRHLD